MEGIQGEQKQKLAHQVYPQIATKIIDYQQGNTHNDHQEKKIPKKSDDCRNVFKKKNVIFEYLQLKLQTAAKRKEIPHPTYMILVLKIEETANLKSPPLSHIDAVNNSQNVYKYSSPVGKNYQWETVNNSPTKQLCSMENQRCFRMEKKLCQKERYTWEKKRKHRNTLSLSKYKCN